MVGGDRVRFCRQCSKNVFNLSGLSRADAEALLHKAEGRLCIALHRRTDGTVLTRDCPVGLARVRRRVASALTFAAALVLGILSAVGSGRIARSGIPINARLDAWNAEARRTKYLGAWLEWIDPTPPAPAPSPTLKGGWSNNDY